MLLPKPIFARRPPPLPQVPQLLLRAVPVWKKGGAGEEEGEGRWKIQAPVRVRGVVRV